MGFIQELADLEKSLAGFHPTHYIREKLIAQIAILKPKAQAERSELADPRTLEQRKQALEKTLSGYHPTHYIRSSLESQITQLDERIKKNERLN
jgi:hypothetical protein